MTYTSHGWHIDGTTLEDRPTGLLTAPCGGPQACKVCEDDTTAALLPDVLKILDEANKPQKVYYAKETVDRLYEILGDQGIEVEKVYHIIDEMQKSAFTTKIRQKNQTPAMEDLWGTAVAGQELNDQQAVTAVFDSLKRLGLSGPQIVSVLNDMDNRGVVFRMEKD